MYIRGLQFLGRNPILGLESFRTGAWKWWVSTRAHIPTCMSSGQVYALQLCKQWPPFVQMKLRVHTCRLHGPTLSPPCQCTKPERLRNSAVNHKIISTYSSLLVIHFYIQSILLQYSFILDPLVLLHVI